MHFQLANILKNKRDFSVAKKASAIFDEVYNGDEMDLKSCDYLISLDSGITHLAGALGVNTKLLLKKYPYWRWGNEEQKVQYYMNYEVYRQEEPGDWESLAYRVKENLENKK